MTPDDPNLENIDFNAFYDMALSEEDEARELVFLLAQTPPSKVSRTFSIPSDSLQMRLKTPPSSPTPARQSSGLVLTSPIPAQQLVSSTSKQSPVVKTRCSPAPPPSMLSDESAFWVVTNGAYPGVYHGRYVISFFI
jgi:hypothetical protein